MSSEQPLLSIVMPCLNEEEAIGICIEKIQNVLKKNNIPGEIIVCDNGSTDNSVKIAESMGVVVVHQPLRGYGNAYLKGFSSAKGKYIIMGDADDTYDFNLIPDFLNKLTIEGYDFVTGSRYLSGTGSKNITFLHRIFGNPMLTAILNLMFGTSYTDVYCGFRGFSRRSYDRIKPVSPGMEFNLELAINAGMSNLKIAEIPIHLQERKGKSKLNTFHDGWRSLRMMLLYCPNKVFLLPGVSILTLGILLHILLITGMTEYKGKNFLDIAGVFATIFSVVGFQIISLGLHAKSYSWSRRFDEHNPELTKFYQIFNLETGLILGIAMILTGTFILLYMVIKWLSLTPPSFPASAWASFASTIIIFGFNTFFTSLFISAMSMKKE